MKIVLKTAHHISAVETLRITSHMLGLFKNNKMALHPTENQSRHHVTGRLYRPLLNVNVLLTEPKRTGFYFGCMVLVHL